MPEEYSPGTGDAIAREVSEARKGLLSSEDFYFI